MNLFSLAIGLALLLQVTTEEQVTIIPLKEIWGYNIPGTRDVQKIEGDRALKQINEIRDMLSKRPPQGREAKPGFAVVGTGPDALREAHAVLSDGEEPRQKLPQNSEASVVFFSFQFGHYVHLHKVIRRGNVVEVYYRFVPHKTKELTEHFALIPLDRLIVGKGRVEIIQSPMEQEFFITGWESVKSEVARRIVCNSFSFVVEADGM